MRKTVLIVFCLFLFAGTAYSSEPWETCKVDQVYNYMNERFPDEAALLREFGEPLRVEEGEVEFDFADSTHAKFKNREYDGIRIGSFLYIFISEFTTSKPGIIEYSGIDIGASREDVMKIFSEQTNIQVEENKVTFEGFSGLCELIFVFENDRVIQMTYNNWPN